MNETEELLRPQMKKKQTMRRNMKQKIKRKTAIQQYENKLWLLMVNAMCVCVCVCGGGGGGGGGGGVVPHFS